MFNSKNWINWIKTENGRKLPVNPATGDVISAHDQANHITYAEAAKTGAPAMVFTPGCGWFFVDIDHCLINGAWSQVAVSVCSWFPGCYIEISQSGEGLHIFGKIPPGCEALPHACKRPDLGIEFYTEDRFCAVTGTSAVGDPNVPPDPGNYTAFLTNYFPPKSDTGASEVPVVWTDSPCPEWAGPEDDNELLARALRSKGAKAIIGAGVTFKQLWEADADALSNIYPDVGGGQERAFDWSQADASLCSHLAFWTGKNCARMERLWAMSALSNREKFNRVDYRRDQTILSAVRICKKVYRDGTMVPKVGLSDPQPDECGIRSGYQYLCPEDQVGHFKGCYYVQRQHKVFTPFGMLKPEQFRVTYGGWAFANDDSGQKTTRNAWDAFSESHVFKTPMVHDVCFRPDLGSANVVESEGKRFINTYVPVPTETAEGDPAPFLDFLNKILPDQNDQDILTSYMAAVVQYPGIKFQWAPILQGTYGNGKSLITKVLEFCVGKEYTHKVNAQDIDNAFNSWLTGKIFIIIDEIKTAAGSKAEEMLKWMITDSRVPIMAKGQDQTTGDNRANFILCSNHYDAVVKRKDDRRYAPFFTRQQCREDMTACGMGGDYFPRIYKWLRGGGYAIINGWLRSYRIKDELNPATSCTWAPRTSSTEAAVARSATPVEQDIYEAIEEGTPGFQGGWISSIALRRLTDKNKIKMSAQQRSHLVETMGYKKHPALSNGRAGSIVATEGGRPVLYVKTGSDREGLTAQQVVPTYCEDQGFPVLGEPTQLRAVKCG